MLKTVLTIILIVVSHFLNLQLTDVKVLHSQFLMKAKQKRNKEKLRREFNRKFEKYNEIEKVPLTPEQEEIIKEMHGNI